MSASEILTLDKALHVEDERIHRMLMRAWFPDWGWHEAARLDEAVEIIRREGNNFQLVVLDLNLPDSKGIETARELRPLTVAPFVISTALNADDVAPYAEELGIYGIIEKSKSYTKERIRPILLNAYRDWRDPRLTMDITTLTEQVKAVTERREKWIKEHETRNG